MAEKKFDTLIILQIIFGIFVLLISVFSLFTENSSMIPLMFILMTGMFFIIGLREYKRTHSLLLGIFYWCISLFSLFVAIKGIMIN